MILLNPFHILNGHTKKVVSHPLRTSFLKKIIDIYQIMTGSVSLLHPDPDEENKKRIIFSKPNELTMTRASFGNIGGWLKKPTVRTLGIYDYLTLGIATAVDEGLLRLFSLSFSLPIIGLFIRLAIRCLLFFTTMLRMMASVLLTLICSPVALVAQISSGIYSLFHEKVAIPDIKLKSKNSMDKDYIGIEALLKQIEKDVNAGKNVSCLSEVTTHDDISVFSLRSQNDITALDIEKFCEQANIQAPACFMVKSARSGTTQTDSSFSRTIPCHVIRPGSGYKNIEEYKTAMLSVASSGLLGSIYVIDASTLKIYLIRSGEWVDPDIKMSERLFEQYEETFRNRSPARTPNEINEWFISRSIKLYPYLEETCYGLQKDSSGMIHVKPIPLPKRTITDDVFYDYYRTENAISLDLVNGTDIDNAFKLVQFAPDNKQYNQLSSLLKEHHHHKRYIEINETSTDVDDRDGVFGLSADNFPHTYQGSFFANITDESQLNALEMNGLYNPDLDERNCLP